jgi:hypothetical protein
MLGGVNALNQEVPRDQNNSLAHRFIQELNEIHQTRRFPGGKAPSEIILLYVAMDSTSLDGGDYFN